MAAPRKIFRIEKMIAPQFAPQRDRQHGEIMQQLNALRVMLETAPAAPTAPAGESRRDDIRHLVSELRLIHSAIRGAPPTQPRPGGSAAASAVRIAGELEAVIGDSELATQKILAAAEDIDQAANNLSATLKGDFGYGLAQDIRDRVIQIFEACNFQDLTSQRVAKVMAALGSLERQIARVLDELARINATLPLHGPRLAADDGHISQGDIDSLFDGDVI